MQIGNKKYPLGMMIILGFGIAGLLGISLVNEKWTIYLVDHRWKQFAEIMRRTLIEDGLLGGTDLASFYLILSIILYFYSNSRFPGPSLRKFSCLFGFITATSLTVLGIVQILKWTIGRARPYNVFNQGFEYSTWYEFGPFYVGNEIFFGSFPSGHTATTALFIPLSYIFICDSLFSKKWIIFGWLLGGLALIYTLTTILARVMATHHWITDGFGSLVIVWGITHWLYYWGLRIPEQRQHFQNHQQPTTSIAFWELRLSSYLILFFLSIGLILIAFNSFLRQNPPSLALLAAIAIPTLIMSIKRGLSLHHEIHKNLIND